MLVEFITHPINFVRGWIWSHSNFDWHGYPRTRPWLPTRVRGWLGYWGGKVLDSLIKHM